MLTTTFCADFGGAAHFDVVRVQDVSEISGVDDAGLPEWATTNGRVVLTHGLSTMLPSVQGRSGRFGSCSPVVLVPDPVPVGLVIDEVLLLDEVSVETDWASGVLYFPLR